MTIQQLREKRNAHAKELRNLVDKYTGAEWTEEIQNKWDAGRKEIEQIDAEIARFQDMLDLEAVNQQSARERAEKEGISEDEAASRGAMELKLFNKWARHGYSRFTDEERQVYAEMSTKIQNLGTQVPSEGGFLVPDEFGNRLFIALKAFGGMREVSTVISTASGATIPYPTTDPTSEEGELLQKEAVTVTDDTSIRFGSVNLNAHMYSSKAIAVPFQLLQDSVIDIEGHLIDRLRTRIARITNRHYTVGTGANQPYGIVNLAGLGKTGETGQATTINDFNELIRLEHSIDPAYRAQGRCRFMFHDNTLMALKEIKDGAGRPIWLPGYNQGGSYQSMPPDLINGYPYTINQNMPTMQANAKSILFGDFSYYMIRDVMQVLFFRMTDSAYTKLACVGFLGFMRTDGNGVWAKSLDGSATADPIKYWANSAK